ncbi:hypothetical protein DYB28_011769 [Aphanomyces astaci]|uniref:Uncharacterized protein n=1 Tax=Aphanomyces astaci TaxID=112090 RepID=A0A397BKI1_APHAT|nr:hypothetical protein DYB36_009595 [Aphanomyces astaci]RHY21518.1 hypothetical protein DYB25_007465 [Aphanomyces astaci]RHY43685.1 hypothetical protein DYB30_011287 [Aphanomyces astaci]RLO05824.1 hypothetical protein DYB28_011769 [Aphanomyces astaci]
MAASQRVLGHPDVFPLIAEFQHGLYMDILEYWRKVNQDGGGGFWASLDLPLHAIDRRLLGSPTQARYQLLVLVAANQMHLVRRLLRCRPHYLTQPVNAMNASAANGHLEIVKFLHHHRTEGCTRRAMDMAAKNGHLPVVQFLHEHRREGCTEFALHSAAQNGHLGTVKFLARHRNEGNVVKAMGVAKLHGHVQCVAVLQCAA